jgi:hypothetical protein
MRNLSFRFFSFIILCSILLSCVSEGQKSSNIQINQDSEKIDTFKYWVPDLEYPVQRMLGVKEVRLKNLRYNYFSIESFLRNGLLDIHLSISDDTITTRYYYNDNDRIISIASDYAYIPLINFYYDEFARVNREIYYQSLLKDSSFLIFDRIYGDSSYFEKGSEFAPDSKVKWKRVGKSIVVEREMFGQDKKILGLLWTKYYDSIGGELHKSFIQTATNICFIEKGFTSQLNEIYMKRFFDTISFDKGYGMDSSLLRHAFSDKYGTTSFRDLIDVDETYSYIYDHKNNWTHKIENGDTIEKRIITYYD